jgi:HAD superfamily hydrolase (TIGR01509 family)
VSGRATVGAPSLVIFDNDGVLVDSESLANRLLAEYLTEQGVPTSYDYSVKHYLGGSLGRVRIDVARRSGPGLADTFEADYERRLNDTFDRALRAMPGVRGVIDHLKDRDIPYCVASSGSHARIQSSLRTAGLWPDFEGRTFSADDVLVGKPDPGLFLWAAESMGVLPAATVVIEDSAVGLQAGLLAGMTVWALAGLSPSAADVVAHRRFESMNEIEIALRLLTDGEVID